jgi:DNA-binding CsgD family transcriptional regulator
MSASAFEAALPDLIDKIGEPHLPVAVDAALRRLTPIDITCIFAYAPGAIPLLLHDGLCGASSPEVMQRYLQGTYLLDCVYTACKAKTPAGLYRLSELAPDAFFEGEYYNSPAVHPCISMDSGTLAEEIVCLVPMADSAYLAYSLMRQNGHAPFSASEFAAFKAVEPQVRALLGRHWRGLKFEATPEASSAANEEGFDIERVFDRFKADQLTSRERAIVSLILRGHSSLSVAERLGIAEGTVKNHRKHIYAKLKISSQAELFSMFVRHAVARAEQI